MTRALVTGARGFLGQNLVRALANSRVEWVEFNRGDDPKELDARLREVDSVFHLAGVNRPENDAEFDEVNHKLTRRLLEAVSRSSAKPMIAFASSTQVSGDTPYAKSKRAAETVLQEYALQHNISIVAVRFPGIFGKWSRPDYNSVVATFCYKISRGMPITIDAAERTIRLMYVDDAVRALLEAPVNSSAGFRIADPSPTYVIALGALADLIASFRRQRETAEVGDFKDPLERKLYATYLSFVKENDLAYPLNPRRDDRGILAEFMKSAHIGQIFVSTTRPGVTRGNHFHNTKAEKFLVLAGDAEVAMSDVRGGGVCRFRVDGRTWRVIDIPPGRTHNITNVGSTEMIVLFWASEAFDPEAPDTFPMPVERQ